MFDHHITNDGYGTTNYIDVSAAATEQLDKVRALVRHATQRLLGDTISVSDDDWRAASRLPDWTRGHVATHLARHADGMGRLVEWARTGERHRQLRPDVRRTHVPP